MHEEVCSGFNCQKWHDIGEHKSIVLIYVKTINQNSLIYIASVEFEFNAQLRLIIDKNVTKFNITLTTTSKKEERVNKLHVLLTNVQSHKTSKSVKIDSHNLIANINFLIKLLYPYNTWELSLVNLDFWHLIIILTTCTVYEITTVTKVWHSRFQIFAIWLPVNFSYFI